MKSKVRVRFERFLLLLVGVSFLSSCSSGNNLLVSKVNYQSVRTSFAQPSAVPDDAKVAAQYIFDPSGKMMVVVFNLTDEILSIDQTKSFLVNTTGMSQSYYDPNVYSSTSGTFSSETSGTTVNLGAIAGALGVGGPLGAFFNGMNVGNSSTIGDYSSTTVTIQDQPEVKVGPKGRMVMSKQFNVDGVGSILIERSYVDLKRDQSPLRFSVCISYKFENEPTGDKLVTDFYVNSSISEDVSSGKVGNAFKSIYAKKPDALAENYYLFNIVNNLPHDRRTYNEGLLMDSGILGYDGVFDTYSHGSLFDYK